MYSRRGQKERGGVSRSRHSFVSHTWSSPPVFRCSSKSSVCICPNCSSTNLACTYFGELFSLRPRVRSREFPIFMAPSAATQWKKLRQTEGTASWSNFIVVIQLVAERVERKKSACSMSCRSRRMLSARSLLDYFDQVLQGDHHYGTSPRIYALCRAGFEFGFNKKCSSFFSECLFWMPHTVKNGQFSSAEVHAGGEKFGPALWQVCKLWSLQRRGDLWLAMSRF